MISVKKLYDRVSALTKSGTSGYFTADEFNSNLYSVQYTVLSTLCDEYEDNQKVADALIEHTLDSSTLTTSANGLLFASAITTSLTNYYRTLQVRYVSGSAEYPCIKVAIGSEAMTLSSPIRKPDISKNRTLWLMRGNNIQVLPKSSGLTFVLTYCKKPAEAKIVFTTAETEDNDYLVIDAGATIDIAFPEGLFNLFTYLMLESMGIEQKESLISAYAELGINRTINTDIK